MNPERRALASRALMLVAGMTTTVTAAEARAFVCTRVVDSGGNESGPSLSWTSRTVHYSLHAAGTADIPSDQEFDVLRNSFLPWETASECAPPNRTTDLAFEEAAMLSNTDRVGFDFLEPEANENLLVFRDDAWPHPGQATQIIALTTTTYNALTGEIFDADIEFNSANFEFTIGDSGVRFDLMNTAVHEIGHVIGLGHPNVPPATMFASADPGDTNKRDLDCDDLNAVVLKYPAGLSNGYCEPATPSCGFCAPPNRLTRTAEVFVSNVDDGAEGGCAATGATGTGWLSLLWVGVLARRRAVRPRR